MFRGTVTQTIVGQLQKFSASVNSCIELLKAAAFFISWLSKTLKENNLTVLL